MPLSQLQLEAFKNPATIIQIQPDNCHTIPQNLAAKFSKHSIVARQLPPQAAVGERIALLETDSAYVPYDFENVNKAVAVVGGFVDEAMEAMEALVGEMMRGVEGYKEMEIVDINPAVAVATFDTPMQAIQFSRGQKRNPAVQTNKLWVSVNRSRMERMRCKAVSKVKKKSNLVIFSPPKSSCTPDSHQWQPRCVGIFGG